MYWVLVWLLEESYYWRSTPNPEPSPQGPRTWLCIGGNQKLEVTGLQVQPLMLMSPHPESLHSQLVSHPYHPIVREGHLSASADCVFTRSKQRDNLRATYEVRSTLLLRVQLCRARKGLSQLLFPPGHKGVECPPRFCLQSVISTLKVTTSRFLQQKIQPGAKESETWKQNKLHTSSLSKLKCSVIPRMVSPISTQCITHCSSYSLSGVVTAPPILLTGSRWPALVLDSTLAQLEQTKDNCLC
jgi:hypothetical protein